MCICMKKLITPSAPTSNIEEAGSDRQRPNGNHKWSAKLHAECYDLHKMTPPLRQ